MNPEAESDGSSTSSPHDSYPSTLWTQIMHAQGNGASWEDAWKVLLERYRGLIQRKIQQWIKDDPEDLANEFIATVFTLKLIPMADRNRGRFRGLLGRALRGFIFDKIRESNAIKRDQRRAELIVESDENEFYRMFDRELAREIVDRALAKMRQRYASIGRAGDFDLLFGNDRSLPIKEIAEKLGKSEGAVKIERHRLTKAFRDFFRQEVADLVPPEEVEKEFRYMLSLFT